jgi:hypothetical protein
MKKIFQLTMLSLISIPSFGQMVMSPEGITAENACNPNTVYFLMESKARPVESIDSIQVKLNQIVKFAKANPTFEGKAAIQFAVNCNGGVGGGFHVVTKSGNDELDKELIAFFKSIETWTPGKIKKKTVDSWYMWRLEIKNGNIIILNK